MLFYPNICTKVSRGKIRWDKIIQIASFEKENTIGGGGGGDGIFLTSPLFLAHLIGFRPLKWNLKYNKASKVD